ncbi:pleckstrin homology domain-containing family M member 1 [Gastrophryne carolinensis]
MLSQERPGQPVDSREVKQKITKKLSSCLRALQIRYVATDDVITSDDDDANGLCAALEAVFVHGLKAKWIKVSPERRRRKGRHVPLPQPVFWSLLKAVTHRNVIGQLESVTYINTEVGRCRSWLRLALNEGLMESYFVTLRRERSRLQDYYQPLALMLDAEDCDVLLSYLQGLASLSFDLSYKSSILNEWTASPLALAGLWLDEAERVLPYERHRRKSLDSASLSSGSEDTSSSMISGRKPDSVSPLSLESASSSSQLSSSLGSDELARDIPDSQMPPTTNASENQSLPLHDAPAVTRLCLPESPAAAAELPKSRSWISEEDFTMAHPGLPVEDAQPGNFLSTPSPDSVQPEEGNPSKTFNVVHRRQIGLSNPFRGLLMMGSLDRKNALGLYKPYYCELTPYELRLLPEGDEQSCAETFSLLRCDSVRPAHSDGRFEVPLHKQRLYLRAACRDEAQDWVDRITEAIQKFKPRKDDSWEILHFPDSPQNSHERNVWSPCGDPASPDGSPEHSEVFDWASPLEVEPDALKESVVYMKIHKKWTRFVFSLSERALKCFLLRNLEKSLYGVYGIETIKDILPDSGLGSPSCFRLVTAKGSLQLQAESAEEAKAWRELVRAACSESEDLMYLPVNGNFQIKSSIREHSLFRYLMRIPTERGLDLQNFKCAGCHKQIGFQFGKAKLCGYSGLYYCGLCHQDERSIIPSRVLHNWDVTERPVSHQAINFLTLVKNEPLFNLKYLNERLYQHTQTMATIGRDREKLRLLGEYLMTCRSGALREVTASLNERRYLLECAHTYSVQDLKQIADGMFEGFLQAMVERASAHVFQCNLCSQRGFICLICNSDDIIYPFQFDSTTRCGACKAVFHIPCKARASQCLRCTRRRRHQHEERNADD